MKEQLQEFIEQSTKVFNKTFKNTPFIFTVLIAFLGGYLILASGLKAFLGLLFLAFSSALIALDFKGK